MFMGLFVCLSVCLCAIQIYSFAPRKLKLSTLGEWRSRLIIVAFSTRYL